MFDNIYKNQKVLITGHTGFKGSWLCLWMESLGAEVVGYALNPPTKPNHLDLLNLDAAGYTADVRDLDALRRAFRESCPEIVFHLAAQAIVRRSYVDPIETIGTNVMGVANLLEACRETPSVKAVVIVTSDKCYDNKEWIWGYRENDRLGGRDPYSASKGCAELITACYQQSFFSSPDRKGQVPLVASVRAGNVIGGGDWGEDRLVPDVMRAAARSLPVGIRNPKSTRPWQHVLDVLAGYMLLGQKLLEAREDFCGAWNFSPGDSGLDVLTVVGKLGENWDKIRFELNLEADSPHEASQLNLDSNKARRLLGWAPCWNGESAFHRTAQWYKAYYESGLVISREQLEQYIQTAVERKIVWTVS